MKKLTVKNYMDFCYFEYKSANSTIYSLGDVVKKDNEIGVIIQIHSEHEYRTDTWGNCSSSEIEPATAMDLIYLSFGNQILPHLGKFGKFFREDNSPKYLRIYDNDGASFDRITAVFTRKYNDEYTYLGMSSNATGYCLHEFSKEIIDRPKYSHLGKPIKFNDLSGKCRIAVYSTYFSLIGL